MLLLTVRDDVRAYSRPRPNWGPPSTPRRFQVFRSHNGHANHTIIATASFSKNFVFKMFSERKTGVFKFFRFEESFWKLHFRDGLMCRMANLTVEEKRHFQIFLAYCVESGAWWNNEF